MSAIAILRPVTVRLAEGSRKPRKFYTIIWRGPLGESGGGLHYQLRRAHEMARECGGYGDHRRRRRRSRGLAGAAARRHDVRRHPAAARGDPVKLSRCRSCDAPIVWTVTTKGKSMPVDADPVIAARGFRLTAHDGDEVRAVFTAAPDAGEKLHVAHWSTCPSADQHRL